MQLQTFWQKNIMVVLALWCLLALGIRPGWAGFGIGCLIWLACLIFTASPVFWNLLAGLNPDPVKAERFLKQAIASGARIPQPYIALAVIYTKQSRWAEALPLVEQAMLYSAKKILPQLRIRLASLHRELGQMEAALAILEELAGQGYRDVSLHINLARTYQLTGRFDEALAAADKARSLDLSNPQPVLIAGRVHFDSGDYSAAKADYEWAIDHLSWPVESFYWLGRAQLELLEYREAVENLTKAVERITEEPDLSDVPVAEAQKWLEKAVILAKSAEPAPESDVAESQAQ
ncbi:tetratricopeptide repeat protein [Hydrogenispora ethanolica]|uniref:Tetratricopeptide repeat protein n=1 Tax=Hydrogenispora ethanolica TaxID=1082276 RepID=A0A4R1RI13_HYDET|nr:tetratricopeptide repeat protein [Hydrogenispora ethanolica]TCL65272.1 tetratricopeptide repeat protein [Hydrogenispora ethanolica]